MLKKVLKKLIVAVSMFVFSACSADGNNPLEEDRTICSTGETILLESAEAVSDATIDIEFGKVTITCGKNCEQTEKTSFDVILKNGGANKIKSDSGGEFSVELTVEELNKLPEYFEILFTVTPPEGFKTPVKSNKNLLSFYRYNARKFRFSLMFSDGYFIVEPKDQLNKLRVTDTKSAKKALDAFINATTKAAIAENAEPVPGAEIVIDTPIDHPRKNRKKRIVSTDTGLAADVIVHCYEFNSEGSITTTSNNEGYFSFKISNPRKRELLFLIVPPENSGFVYDANSMLISLPEAESNIYDLLLTYEYSHEDKKGKFIIVGPLPFKDPCSARWNPTCKPLDCKMVGGVWGKCQYLYDHLTGGYKCGCSSQVCNADCSGKCKLPDGSEGICHIEEIVTNNNGAEITVKRCVCGPVNIACRMYCNDDLHCMYLTNNQFPLCREDLYGYRFCTRHCTQSSECQDPFSMCVKMADERGVCICPCVNADNVDAHCNPIGMSNPHCMNITFGALADCVNLDNDTAGECSLCCNEDNNCPEGMICRDLAQPLNDRCTKACMCHEPAPQNMCRPCNSDQECAAGEVCADDDNDSNTPQVCTRVCPSIYPCPTSPVYTYCDNNISKYCICKDSGVSLCETVCVNHSDCPPGFFCADDDVNPHTPRICTKTCGDCPAPMICNNDANLPVAVCMCPRDFCRSCKSDLDCHHGYSCLDSDGDPQTPDVCTISCFSDYECPLNISCNLTTKSCDCNRCSRWSNPECEPKTCYQDGVFGKCKRIEDRCQCALSDAP